MADSPHHASLIWHGQVSTSVRLHYQTVGDPNPVDVPVESTGTTHMATLWSLPGLSEVLYTFTDDASGETCSGNFQTAGLQPGLPDLDVTLNYSDSIGSWSDLAGVTMGSPGMLFVLDRRGVLRWHSLHDAHLNSSAVAVSNGTLFYNSFDLDRTNDVNQIKSIALRSGSDQESI